MNMRAKLAMLLVIGMLLWMADAVGCGRSFGQGSYSRIGPIRTENLEAAPQDRIRQTIASSDSPQQRGQALWTLGKDFEQRGDYVAALASYQEIVRTQSAVTGDLDLQMARVRAHLAVEQHWRDPDLRQTARRMNIEDGLRIYREVGRTVTSSYVDEVGYRELFMAGMINLRAALANETFLEAWQLQGRDLERSTFIAAADVIERRALEDHAMSGFAARGHLRNLCTESQRSLGLPCGVIISEFIFAAGEHLDSYSAFLTGDMYRGVMGDIEGRFVGFGVTITETQAGAMILDVIPGGPAAEAGLKPGDLIIAIDGQSVVDADLDAVVRKLRGEEGTSARMVVIRGTDQKEFVVTRRPIIVPSVRDSSRMGPDQSIGYVKLTSFQRSTSTELDIAIKALQAQGEITGLVLDLRGNPGGLVDAAVEVTSMFLRSGTVLTTKSRGSDQTKTYPVSRLRSSYVDLPLVILTDHNTASASEIVAGAMRDHQRAVLIGERTFGKGLVQSIMPLDFGRSAMYLTTARYYGPQGESFQGVGIEPHVYVAMPSAQAVSVEPLENVQGTPAWVDPNLARRVNPHVENKVLQPTEPADDNTSSDDRGLTPDDPVIRRAIDTLSPKSTAVANVGVDARPAAGRPTAMAAP